MRKTTVLSAVFLYISTLILTVKAQTTDPSNVNPQSTTTLIGQVIAIVVIIVVFSFIAYAGYKLLKKWSTSQTD